VFNQHNPAKAADFVTGDVIWHGGGLGDIVVTATVKGSLLGAPADGKPVRWDAVDIYRVTDGKISEKWADDDAAIMAQVVAFNPPWAA
jgi:predicted SnoaL-like aldol condensation-catalyzing enzyme